MPRLIKILINQFIDSLLWLLSTCPLRCSHSSLHGGGLNGWIRALPRAAIDGTLNSVLGTASEHDGNQNRMVVERIKKLCDAASGSCPCQYLNRASFNGHLSGAQ